MSEIRDLRGWVESASGEALEDVLAELTGETAPSAPASGAASALGRNPFADEVEYDPFDASLSAMTPALPWKSPAPGAPGEAPVEAEPAEVAESRPLARRPWSTTPSLAEIEAPYPSGLLDRLLTGEIRQRLTALGHLVETEVDYDRFGMSPDTLRRAFPFFYALYKLYFRVQSNGHEHLPARGPAILASNHGGLLPFDGAMLVIDVMLGTDPPRLARAVVDRWAGGLPWVSVFYARVGQVVGTRENFSDLLEDGQLVLVFPEGMAGARKPITQRHRLQRFHVGFVEEALRAGAPIVPTAVIGTDDQAPILYDFKGLAKRLGLPSLPITPTFPLLGPLGLLPYPVQYRVVYGEPMNIHERFGPEEADDPRLVRYLAEQVRQQVQKLVDREL